MRSRFLRLRMSFSENRCPLFRDALMLSRIDEIAKDAGLAELLAGFEPLQALHQDETIAVTPHQDRRLLAMLHDALGELVDRGGLEFGAAFDRDVDVGDGNRLALHHGLISAAPEGSVG